MASRRWRRRRLRVVNPGRGAFAKNGVVLTDSLPSLLHAFAFSIALAAVLRRGPHAAEVACIGWWVLEMIGEAVQHPAIAGRIAAAVEAGGFGLALQPVARYAQHGTFDPGDLVAATVGCTAAWWLLRHGTRIARRRRAH